MKKNGTVVENRTVMAENWEPGEEAVFEFETEKDFDKIVVKDIDY